MIYITLQNIFSQKSLNECLNHDLIFDTPQSIPTSKSFKTDEYIRRTSPFRANFSKKSSLQVQQDNNVQVPFINCANKSFFFWGLSLALHACWCNIMTIDMYTYKYHSSYLNNETWHPGMRNHYIILCSNVVGSRHFLQKQKMVEWGKCNLFWHGMTWSQPTFPSCTMFPPPQHKIIGR